MNNHAAAPLDWSTSSYGATAAPSPMDLAALGQHLHLCKGSRGRLFALQCVAETMNGFVTARFVTTLLATVLLVSIGTLVL